jgi:phosphoribosylformylglycinamidine (FGAM) synthase PurS component
LKPKFINKLYFETVTAGESDSAETSSVSESDKSDSESGSATASKNILSSVKPVESKPSSKPEAAAPAVANAKSSSGGHRVKFLRIAKVSEEEIRRIDEEKQQKAVDAIDKAVGFSKVIRKISQSVSYFLYWNLK